MYSKKQPIHQEQQLQVQASLINPLHFLLKDYWRFYFLAGTKQVQCLILPYLSFHHTKLVISWLRDIFCRVWTISAPQMQASFYVPRMNYSHSCKRRGDAAALFLSSSSSSRVWVVELPVNLLAVNLDSFTLILSRIIISWHDPSWMNEWMFTRSIP